MKHGILTVVAPVKEGMREELREQLGGINHAQLAANLEGLHFAAASIVEDPGQQLNAHLVFEASFDGTRETFVIHLVSRLPGLVDSVFGCCEGYPLAGTRVPIHARNFLLTEDEGADAIFIAHPSHSVGRIHQERELRRVLVERLGAISPFQLSAGRRYPPPLQQSLYEDLRRYISQIPSLAGLLTLPSRPLPTRGLRLFRTTISAVVVVGLLAFLGWVYASSLAIKAWLTMRFWLGVSLVLRLSAGRWRVVVRLALLALGLAAARWLHDHTALAPVIDWLVTGLRWIAIVMFWTVIALAVVAAIWLIAIQCLEFSDAPDPTLPSWDSAHEERLRQLENVAVQNHLAGINRIKPGRLRLWTLKLVLFAVHLLKQIENGGDLSGVVTIQFARWVIVKINGDNWLLFLANYDGDWGAYLGDFVSQASSGVTAIWSNCVGFPRAWLLFLGGSRDERAFKSYARKSQHETLFRFTAYPELAVADISNHAAIRETLGDSPDVAAIDDFLRRL